MTFLSVAAASASARLSVLLRTSSADFFLSSSAFCTAAPSRSFDSASAAARRTSDTEFSRGSAAPAGAASAAGIRAGDGAKSAAGAAAGAGAGAGAAVVPGTKEREAVREMAGSAPPTA